MSASGGKMGPSLTQEILSHLGLASKTAAWGTLGTLRTFLNFSVDKDAQRLLRAITGQGVDRSAIVDVLTNRSREQRQLISRAFQERTQQDLLKSLRAALSGNLERIVMALLQPAARFDAQELRTALKASDSAVDVAIEILATRTPPRLQECLAVYKHDFQVEAVDDITSQTNGILRDLLLALVKETEPNYQVLIRILISRCETDLLSIRAEFKKKFGKSLYSSLQDAVKGDCQSALLALCRAEDM
ncbi:annexin A9 isoform X4 [Macaca fascicularis]|uniref:annexin A9 isoform X4 n=1 Tax=Macaca fascicularis TaxID=9541 RepID=UPI003D15B846